MKVINDKEIKGISYGEIPAGACFRYSDGRKIYIKTSEGTKHVSIHNGNIYTLPSHDSRFLLVNAEVHVNG